MKKQRIERFFDNIRPGNCEVIIGDYNDTTRIKVDSCIRVERADNISYLISGQIVEGVTERNRGKYSKETFIYTITGDEEVLGISNDIYY